MFHCRKFSQSATGKPCFRCSPLLASLRRLSGRCQWATLSIQNRGTRRGTQARRLFARVPEFSCSRTFCSPPHAARLRWPGHLRWHLLEPRCTQCNLSRQADKCGLELRRVHACATARRRRFFHDIVRQRHDSSETGWRPGDARRAVGSTTGVTMSGPASRPASGKKEALAARSFCRTSGVMETAASPQDCAPRRVWSKTVEIRLYVFAHT